MDAVGDVEHLRHVVRDEDDGDAPVAQVADELEHLVRLANAERGGRLVEHDDLRAERRGACHGDGLALAARQVLDGHRDVLQRRDAERLELVPRLLAHALLVDDAEDRTEDALLASLPTEEQVRGDVERR